jgi:hypothetical protein
LAKKDIYLDMFGIAWLPYYLVRMNGQLQQVAAFPAAQK